MKSLNFEWNQRKSSANIKQHGVSFEEAKTAFYDEYAIQFPDPEHSDEEGRFLLLGTSFILKTPVVCHCYGEEDSVIRIISARKGDKDEEIFYWSEQK